MKTENNARLKYKIHQKRNRRPAECNNATPSLFHSNHSDLQNSSSKKKEQTNTKNEFNSPVVPTRTCGQPTERLFVAIASLKDSRGEKAKAKKILKRGVKGVGGITFLHSVSFSRILYLILQGPLYNQLEVCQILLGKFSNLRSPGETWIPCLLSHSRCLECAWQTP